MTVPGSSSVLAAGSDSTESGPSAVEAEASAGATYEIKLK